MKLEASLSRKATEPAISGAWPTRPSATFFASRAMNAGFSFYKPGLGNGPGERELQRTPRAP